MATVDDRVVSMAFESTKFQQGISTSLSAIDKLNASLKGVGKDTNFDQIDKSANKVTFFGLTSAIDKIKAKFGRGIPEASDAFTDVEKASGKVGFTGLSSAIDKIKGKFGFPEAADGFASVEKASGKVTLSGLGKAIDGIGVKFGAVQTIAVAALGTISSKATVAGGNIAKGLTLEPLTGGMKEYETRLNSIQTILSNTKAAGNDLKDVNRTLAELNRYSDKTIYNFGEMAKNIGTFTAAGVDLKTATASIKGIANLAALSGSNSQQAATAMYQLSQAISSGRVSLQDWNSVVNAGMGGAVFQRALAQTAVAMGALNESAVTLEGKMKNVKVEGQSFRESIMAAPGEQSWLTKEVLTGTLQQFTGDLTDAELAAQGFTKAQIKSIQAQAKTAVDAATKVKTLAGVIDTAKETAESGWSDTWQIIFGDFKEARTLFTGISNAVNGFISDSANARNKVLEDWKELGGRKILIQSIANVFEALGEVLKPIKKAFRDIFPAKTGKDLLELTKKFRDFTETLTPGPETVENLRRTFKGFFAVLDIGKEILSGIWEGVKELFSAIGDGSGTTLDLTGNIGDLIVELRDWLKEGDRLKRFFRGIGEILAVPIRLIGVLSSALNDLFFGGDSKGASDSLAGMSDGLDKAGKAASVAERAWDGFVKIMEKAGELFGPIIDAIGDAFKNLPDAISNALSSANYDTVFKIIQTTLIGGIFLAIKKAIGGGLNIDLGGGVLSNLTGSLDSLNGSLKAIQTNIKANTLLQIATAVTMLAAAVGILSLIKPERLTSAMTAVTVGLGQLMGAMALMTKMSAGGFATVTILGGAGALVVLATALTILSAPLLLISLLDWEGIAKGLSGVGGLLLALALAVKPLSAASLGMIAAGLGISALAIALNILAGAVKIFSTMSWGDMTKGLVGVTAALAGIGVAVGLIPPSILLIGPGLIAVGFALAAIGGAVKIFASMKIGDMLKGLVGIGAALVTIGLAVGLMPPTLPITAAGLVLVGVAMNALAGAIGILGSMKISTLAKGIISMGAALAVLALGLTAMIATLPGAVALLAAAGAFAILVPMIGLLGAMKWSTILKGLGSMVLSIIALGLAGTVAAPGLIILGLGLTALGAGLALVTGAVYLLIKGLVLLADDGAKGIGVTVAAFTAFIAILPKIIIDFVKGLVEIVAQIAKIAPDIVDSLAKIIISLLDVIIKAAPKIGKAAIELIGAFLKVLRKKVPDFIKTGWVILQAFLKGLEDNVGEVTKLALDILIKFLKALAKKLPDVVDAGADVMVALLDGIADNVKDVVDAAFDIVVKFVKAVGNNLYRVVDAGADMIIKLIKGIGNKINEMVDAGADAMVKFVKGVGNSAQRVVKAGVKSAGKFITGLSRGLVKMADVAADAIIDFLNGLAKVIEKKGPELRRAGARLAAAIWSGFTGGLPSPGSGWDSVKRSLFGEKGVKGDLAERVLEALANAAAVISKAQNKILKSVGRDLGGDFMDGLLGIIKETDRIDDAIAAMTEKFAVRIAESREKISKKQEEIDKLEEGKENKKQNRRIEKLEKILKQEQELRDRLLAANKTMNSKLGEQKGELRELIAAYDLITEQLEAAEQALTEAIDAKNQAALDLQGQYSTLPELVKEDEEGNPLDQLATYMDALKTQVDATKKFKETLDKLRAAGLDDTTYQKLLDEGVGGQAFADQLLAGGKTAIDAINELDSQLITEATKLALNSANELHKAGITAAHELINGMDTGLKSKQSTLFKAMEDLAKKMIQAIKKKLKIKSPSEEFAELGKFSVQGMARGLNKSSRIVTDAVTGVSKDALSAMKSKMKMISDVVADQIDPNPTITPILDLSNIQNGSKSLQSMMNVVPITAAASYGQATSISSMQEAVKLAKEALAEQSVIRFEQNNYSPESLSSIEIYRQTKNQLAQARPVLT